MSSRMYDTPDGKFPSVTTKLSIVGKPALVAWSANVEREMVIVESGKLHAEINESQLVVSSFQWATTLQDRLGKERAHQRELTKAGEIGKQLHSLVEWTLKAQMLKEVGPAPRVSDKAQHAFLAWKEWAKSVELKPLLVEQKVWSKTNKYAGTLDLLALVNGRETVVDWKTGKAVYPEAHLQNAAYRCALREMGLGDPEDGLIVRLPKLETDPEFEVVKAGHMPDGSYMPESKLMDVFLCVSKLWDYMELMDTYDKKQVETVAAD